MVELHGKSCVIVGGGQIGERKAEALLETGASVLVVSPQVTGCIEAWVAEGRLSWRAKEYAREDLEGAFIVIAATNRPEVNQQVYADITQSLLCSLYDIVDNPQLSSFIMPAVVRRGRLVMAVSTSGAGPQLAKEIRNRLSAEYGEEYEEYLDFLYEYRRKVRELFSGADERKRLLREVLQWNVLERIQSCSKEEWEEWKTYVLSFIHRQLPE
jgi:precorrin-2 dehydrogenase / sirohydrochlorin ferrochelatase